MLFAITIESCVRAEKCIVAARYRNESETFRCNLVKLWLLIGLMNFCEIWSLISLMNFGEILLLIGLMNFRETWLLIGLTNFNEI